METPITRYLVDAIAAEKSFETQLKGFAEESTDSEARAAFNTHAEQTRFQYEDLTKRLQALGESPSALKSALAHFFGMAPKAAQVGHAAEERTTQDLIMAFSVENAEVAMYEALIVAAKSAGDTETVSLAKRIQQQEKETAEKVWKLIAPAATRAFAAVSSGGKESAQDVIVRYLQDAEAAERNFEDALAAFSKQGDQGQVQSMLSKMSGIAKTQHDRLEARLNQLGGSRSTAKSVLAHVLAFTPTSAQLGHAASEKNTQHLMVVYAAAAAEMGMYESLAAAAQAAGDTETAQLARQLQSEEKQDHTNAWEQLGRTARTAMAQAATRQ